MFVCKLCKESSAHSEGCIGANHGLCHWCYARCTTIGRPTHVMNVFNCGALPQSILRITDPSDWLLLSGHYHGERFVYDDSDSDDSDEET